MASVDETACRSWNDCREAMFDSLYPTGSFEPGRYIFRGVGSDEWTLESSFDRYAADTVLGERQAGAERLLAYFAEQCATDEEIQLCPDDNDERVALAQHYGLPTRALDWSESPYIAAYFAFGDGAAKGVPHPATNVAIWALDRSHSVWNGSMGARVLSIRRTGNPRLLRQRGAFTYLQAPYASLESYVAACPDGGVALRKFTCSREESGAALSDLAAMGISATRLFPDLTGAARAALVLDGLGEH